MGKHNICVVGTGYVGLVTGACLAEIGHRVVCVDSDKKKIAAIQAGQIPIHEPGIEPLVAKHRKSGRLTFQSSIAAAINQKGAQAEVVFIAVGTPPRPDGSADLSAVEAVAQEVAANMKGYTLLVDKSTVPVETGEWVSRTVKKFNKGDVPYDVASNPEFLSEGSAVQDFLKPDRIVLGVPTPRAEALLRSVYEPIKAPVLVTDVKSAELIKHASNSFLATKISFINAISALCEKVGADVSMVAQGMGMDKRIGPSFLKAGVGFGGFCLHPKESAVLRDPSGVTRAQPIEESYDQIIETGASARSWEAWSLNQETERMEYRPVTAVSRREYDGVMITIETSNGKKARVTADHPVLVKAADQWRTLHASEVREGDLMPCFISTLVVAAPAEVAEPAEVAAAAPAKPHKNGTHPRHHQPESVDERLNHEVGLTKVAKVARAAYKGPVFGLEIAGNETFTLDSGLILHNCFPKDLEAFHWIAKQKGYDFKLLESVKEINEHQKAWVIRKLEEELWNLEGKKVAVLGLAFKPNTDDMRFAPSLDIIAKLKERRVEVSVYDPVAMSKAKINLNHVRYAKDPYDAAKGADALAIVTEWAEFKDLDLGKLKKAMNNPLILDGRNVLDGAKARAKGFAYRGVGKA